MNAIPVFEASETQSGVFFLQHSVIVRLHTLPFEATLGEFIFFAGRKRVIEIAL
jgi:hypothetical protein